MYGLQYIFAEHCGTEVWRGYEELKKSILSKTEILASNFQFSAMRKKISEHFVLLLMLKYGLIRP